MKKIIILGSTGSIGTQALEIIEANPDKFKVVGLAGNTNRDLLTEQGNKFSVQDFTNLNIRHVRSNCE